MLRAHVQRDRSSIRSEAAIGGKVGFRLSVAVALVVAASAKPVAAQLTAGAGEIQTVVAARQTLDQFCGLSVESIPATMLASAEGIAIFPNMIKGGFIIGANYGKGVLHMRNPDRTWSPPVMVQMGGGSIGFQVGVQAADIVLVFATPQSLRGIMNGQKVTLGADASVALGPVGRQANAATDARLGAEIYSYARSRGLFLGVSLSGADLSIDNNANSMLYGRFGVTPADVFANRGLAVHPEVQQLIDDLNARSNQFAQARTAAVPAPAPPLAPASAAAVPAPPPLVTPQPVPQPAVPTTVPSTVPITPIAPAAPVAPAVPAPLPPSVVNPPLVPIRPTR
jgi:lipid-binding SYLF domain-containing protein